MPLEKAIITDLETGDEIPVLFNPEEYTLNRENNFAQTGVPGLIAPITQFVNGNAQTLEMELFFDTYEQHSQGSTLINQAGEDVRKLTDKLITLMDKNPETHAPPVLEIVWGTLVFQCVLARVNQRFTMFKEDGTPVRARLQVTFNQYVEPAQAAKKTKQETADYTKVYLVGQDESLSAIAGRVYEDPTLWRPIALHNGLTDPRTLIIGQRLRIPRLPYRDPDTGEIYR